MSAYQPIGISCVASYILDKIPGLEVRLLDFTVEKFSPGLYRKQLQDFRPGIVGISIITLNSAGGRQIAELTREYDPAILTVVGGVHATMRPEECLSYGDIAVRGEGEETFYEIVQGKELGSIKGISYQKEGNIIHNAPRERIENLDNLPFAAHHLFQMERYKAFPAWGIMASRGCPFDCIFCCSPKMWGRIVKFRSSSSVVNEMEYLHREFGVKHINFFDDAINVSQPWLIDVCEEIVRRGLHKEMSFSGMLRADKKLVSPELLQKLGETNFISVGLGIESGSAGILKSINKLLTLDDARNAIKMIRNSDIKRLKGFFMVGNWDETMGDIFNTWRFVLSNNIQPAFSICTPFPGTRFYDLLKERGYMVNDPDWSNFNQYTPIVRTNKMSKSGIFALFCFSILLQLVFSFTRGRNAGHTALKIVYHSLDVVKVSVARLTKPWHGATTLKL